MLVEIIRREIRDHLTSVRLLFSFIIIIAVMVLAGLIFNIKYDQAVQDYNQNFSDNQSRVKEAAQSLRSFTYFDQSVYLKPNSLQFCAEGWEKELPNTCQVGYFHLRLPENTKRENFMMSRFLELDWTFLVSIVTSFVIIALSYNAISGEKEAGTLRLMLANAIPRTTIILGKYLGIMLCVLVPIFIALVLNLLIILIGGKVLFQSTDWLRILMIMGISLVYLSAFVLLSLTISSLTSRPIVSAIILFSLWVIFVIIVPNTGGLVAGEFYQIPTRHEIEEQIRLRQDQIWRAAPEGALSPDGIYNMTGEVPSHIRQRAEMVHRILETENNLYQIYVSQMLRQVQIARNITRISPTASYQYASEAMAGTGLVRFQRFYSQVKQYRQQLIDFVQAEDQKDNDSPHLIYAWENLASLNPVAVAAIPMFTEQDTTIVAAIQAAFLDLVLLIGINGLFFVLAFGAFGRYDVR